MFILLATTATEGSPLKLFITIAITLIVAVGAGFKVFAILRDKKVDATSLEALVNSIYKDEELIGLLKSVFTDDCFRNSNNYEEFIHNVHMEARKLVSDYINKNISYIPEVLRPLVTEDNMEYVAKNVLGFIGYDGKKLSDLFDKYLEDLVVTEEDEPADEDDAVQAAEEATIGIALAVEEAVAPLVTDEEIPEVAVSEDEEIVADTIEGETPELVVNEAAENIQEEYLATEETTEEVDETDVEESVEEETTEEVDDTDIKEATEEEVIQYLDQKNDVTEEAVVDTELNDEPVEEVVSEPTVTVDDTGNVKVSENTFF